MSISTTLARQFGFAKLDDFFAGAGRGDISPRQLQGALRADEAPPSAIEPQPIVSNPRAQPGGILMVGVDKLLTVPAGAASRRRPTPSSVSCRAAAA